MPKSESLSPRAGNEQPHTATWISPGRLAEQLAQADHVLLCIDYDGTLVEFAADVRHTATPEEAVGLLRALLEHPRITPAIVTGRSMEDVRARIDLPGLILAAEHGKDIEAPGWRRAFKPEPEVQAAIDRIAERWEILLEGQPGCYMQRKPLSGTFSTRRAPVEMWEPLAAGARECGREEVAAGLVTFTGGKGLVELRPRGGWTKATATLLLAERERELRPNEEVLVVFFGDDLTDEDAMEQLHRVPPSLGVRISETLPDVTAGDVLLRSVDEVHETLRLLLECMPTR
jgi:trehalose 6-phosphate phosphatase